MPPELATREERRSRDAGDTHFADEPVGERHVVFESEGPDVAEDVVRTLRSVRAEAGALEDGDQVIAADAVLARQPVVVRPPELECRGDRLLQWRGRADRDEVV